LLKKKEIEVEIEEKDDTPAQAAQPANQTPNNLPQQTEDTVMKDAEQPAPGEQPKQPESKDVEMKDVEPPKPEPAKPKFRKEKQMRTFYSKLPLEVKYIEYTHQEIEKATQAEEILRADDNYGIETLNAKNKLESSIYPHVTISRHFMPDLLSQMKSQQLTNI